MTIPYFYTYSFIPHLLHAYTHSTSYSCTYCSHALFIHNVYKITLIQIHIIIRYIYIYERRKGSGIKKAIGKTAILGKHIPLLQWFCSLVINWFILFYCWCPYQLAIGKRNTFTSIFPDLNQYSRDNTANLPMLIHSFSHFWELRQQRDLKPQVSFLQCHRVLPHNSHTWFKIANMIQMDRMLYLQ